MVRLMLTLTPIVCVLAAIAFSKVFSIYLKDEGHPDSEDDDDAKEKNEKYYDKVAIMSLPFQNYCHNMSMMLFILNLGLLEDPLPL